jgi:hypothetical protein
VNVDRARRDQNLDSRAPYEGVHDTTSRRGAERSSYCGGHSSNQTYDSRRADRDDLDTRYRHESRHDEHTQHPNRRALRTTTQCSRGTGIQIDVDQAALAADQEEDHAFRRRRADRDDGGHQATH